MMTDVHYSLFTFVNAFMNRHLHQNILNPLLTHTHTHTCSQEVYNLLDQMSKRIGWLVTNYVRDMIQYDIVLQYNTLVLHTLLYTLLYQYLRELKASHGLSSSTPRRIHCVTIFFSPSRTGHPECSVRPVSVIRVSGSMYEKNTALPIFGLTCTPALRKFV